ncbi:MAG TPA: DUF3006 domain-containing protein [Ruminococcus sp.]|nr:DUF3006 domain-containing protein [Ruminococcus sp.]
MTRIDRFEGDMAVLETDEGMLDIRREELPEDAREGDILIYGKNGWQADKKATAARRSAMKNKLRRRIRRND